MNIIVKITLVLFLLTSCKTTDVDPKVTIIKKVIKKSVDK